MLVLTRRLGEKVIVNDDIEVAILGINGNQVKIGFLADSGVCIDREEIYKKMNGHTRKNNSYPIDKKEFVNEN